MENICSHNQKCRYTHGFYCEDCNEFFSKDSPTYRSGDLLSDIWYVLNNINADEWRANKREFGDVKVMLKKIGIGIKHDNYEELISEAEDVMVKYGKDATSASVVLK